MDATQWRQLQDAFFGLYGPIIQTLCTGGFAALVIFILLVSALALVRGRQSISR